MKSRYRFATAAIPLAAIALMIAAASAGVDPLEEFPINSIIVGDQLEPAIAADNAGGFLCAWYTEPSINADGDSRAVLARRFDAGGEPIGPDFVVNTYTTGSQSDAAVACAPSPNCLIVWDSGLQGGIRGQIFDGVGNRVGGEIAINQFTTGFQGDARIAAFGNGFVVVWESHGDQDGSGSGIFGRSFGNGGAPLSDEVQVNTYTTENQSAAAIAAIPESGFLVVWDSFGQDGDGMGIFAQLYNRQGLPTGTEFQVNTYTTLNQRYPVVASSSTSYLVVWRSQHDGSSTGIFAQLYDIEGVALGEEFQVNTFTTGVQESPAVSSDGADGFAVVWTSEDQDGSDDGIFGQRYDAGGMPLGSEFAVNTHTEESQALPAVAGIGSFIVAWESRFQDGDGRGIIGRFFEDVNRRDCPGDCNRDGTVSIAELILGVNIALGRNDVAACESLDFDSDGTIAVAELVRAVRSALEDCAA